VGETYQCKPTTGKSSNLTTSPTNLQKSASTTTVETNSDTAHTKELEPTAHSPPAPQPYVYPTRTRRAPDRLNLICVYPMTARKAIKENTDEAIPVIKKELVALLDKHVFHGVKYGSLNPASKRVSSDHK
jgi:hypothetical protein